jgi:hypothetical protein
MHWTKKLSVSKNLMETRTIKYPKSLWKCWGEFLLLGQHVEGVPPPRTACWGCSSSTDGMLRVFLLHGRHVEGVPPPRTACWGCSSSSDGMLRVFLLLGRHVEQSCSSINDVVCANRVDELDYLVLNCTALMYFNIKYCRCIWIWQNLKLWTMDLYPLASMLVTPDPERFQGSKINCLKFPKYTKLNFYHG